MGVFFPKVRKSGFDAGELFSLGLVVLKILSGAFETSLEFSQVHAERGDLLLQLVPLLSGRVHLLEDSLQVLPSRSGIPLSTGFCFLDFSRLSLKEFHFRPGLVEEFPRALRLADVDPGLGKFFLKFSKVCFHPVPLNLQGLQTPQNGKLGQFTAVADSQ